MEDEVWDGVKSYSYRVEGKASLLLFEYELAAHTCANSGYLRFRSIFCVILSARWGMKSTLFDFDEIWYTGRVLSKTAVSAIIFFLSRPVQAPQAPKVAKKHAHFGNPCNFGRSYLRFYMDWKCVWDVHGRKIWWSTFFSRDLGPIGPNSF